MLRAWRCFRRWKLEEDIQRRIPSGKVGPGRRSAAALPFAKSRWNGNFPVCRLARCDSGVGRGCTGARPIRQSWPRPMQHGRVSFRQIALERKFPGLPSCAMRFRRWKRMHGGASPSGKISPAGAVRPRFLSPNRVGTEIPCGYYPAFPKSCEKKSRAKFWGATAGMRLKNLPLSEICPQNDASHGKKANFARNRSPFADGASPKAVLLLF